MPKTKNFNPLKDTVKTVIHWYAEVQDLPETLKKKVSNDMNKADRQLEQLKKKLNKAQNLLKKTREKRIDASNRVKIKATAAAKKSLAKSKTAFNRASKSFNILNKKLEKAQTLLNHAQIRQTYYQALAKAFTTVTELFQKKHGKKAASKSTKKTKKSKTSK